VRLALVWCSSKMVNFTIDEVRVSAVQSSDETEKKKKRFWIEKKN
jgi:hypothetical protein